MCLYRVSKSNMYLNALQAHLSGMYIGCQMVIELKVIIHTYIHTYIHACMHTYIHTLIHTNIYTYIIRTYIIHTYIRLFVCFGSVTALVPRGQFPVEDLRSAPLPPGHSSSPGLWLPSCSLSPIILPCILHQVCITHPCPPVLYRYPTVPSLPFICLPVIHIPLHLGHGPSPEKSLENRFRSDFLGATWNHYNSNRYYKYSSRKKVPAHWLAHFLVLGHFHMKITKNVKFLGFLSKIVAFKTWMFILYTNILKMLHFVFLVREFLKVPPGGQIWN